MSEYIHKIYDTDKELNYILTRKSNIANAVVDVLAGTATVVDESKNEVVKSLFKDEEALQKAINENKNILGNIGLKSKITVNERALLMFMLITQDYEDNEMYNLTINREVISKIFSSKNQNNQRLIREAVNGLMRNSFLYYRGLEVVESHILLQSENCFIDNGRSIRVMINPELKEHFASFKKCSYMQTAAINILNLKEESKPLFLHIKKLDGYLNSKKAAGSYIYLSETELLKIYNSKRKNFAIFKSEKITPAIKDINLNTDSIITVRRMTVKEMRARSKYLENLDKCIIATIKNKVIDLPKDRVVKAIDKIAGEMFKIEEGEFKIINLKFDPVTATNIMVSLKTAESIEFSRTVHVNILMERFKEQIENSEDERVEEMPI